jgi:hypothetical protein
VSERSLRVIKCIVPRLSQARAKGQDETGGNKEKLYDKLTLSRHAWGGEQRVWSRESANTQERTENRDPTGGHGAFPDFLSRCPSTRDQKHVMLNSPEARAIASYGSSYYDEKALWRHFEPPACLRTTLDDS